MKKLLIVPFILMLFIACTNSETTSDPKADLSAQTQMIMKNDWAVSYYLDSGKDETSDFNGYRFTFNPDGKFTATSGSNIFTGTWTILQGSSSPDDSGNHSDDSLSRLTIRVSGNKQMDDLNHKWVVDKITETEIWLRDDNPASNEIIKFKR